MGTKRVGLARTEALLENLKREINWGSAQHAPEGVALNTGCRKVQSFNGTLANIGDGTSAFGADDVLVELGELDITVPDGMQTPTKIIIDKVYFNVTTAAGQTLVGHLSLSATTGTAANAAIDTPTEIFGAGALMVAPDGSGATTGYTEADLNYNSAALTYASPNIAVATTLKYLYACTTTALNADARAGRFNVVVEYTVL
jgi:hypothetical protein